MNEWTLEGNLVGGLEVIRRRLNEDKRAVDNLRRLVNVRANDPLDAVFKELNRKLDELLFLVECAPDV